MIVKVFLQERVLQNASGLHLENLIIDLSGLQTTDTFVAQQLFRLFHTLSLLGIQPIVSGISPAIAQTLVHLGLTFGRIKSFATLKQVYALSKNEKELDSIRALSLDPSIFPIILAQS